MNYPTLTSHIPAARTRAASGLITAAVCGGLSVFLLTRESDAPAEVRSARAGHISATPLISPPLPAGPDAEPEKLKAAEAVLSEITTPAGMNRLSDSSLPLEQKLAALTGAMRSQDQKTAVEAARRAVYLIKSADYTKFAGPLLLDATLSPAAMSVLGLNAYDRDVACSLPLLARIKETPGHPLKAEAADTLSFYLGEETGALSGEDLRSAVEEYLKNQKR